MWLLLAIILMVIWGVSFFAFHVTAFLIHLLILGAIISFVLHFVSGRNS